MADHQSGFQSEYAMDGRAIFIGLEGARWLTIGWKRPFGPAANGRRGRRSLGEK
jgi:hypothetical protein